jgi:Zn-dependent peptidase ImmA (M78 family)
LDIEPIHDLQSQLDMDAYLKVDRSGIVVDYDSYMNPKLTNRLRFSFAHEVGHYFLHSDIYAQLDIKTPEDWKEFTNNLPESEYANFEWQANEFAGRLLVPYDTLKSEASKVYEIIQNDADLKDYLNRDHDAVLSRVAPSLRRKFGVSEAVIETRVRREGLWPPTG